MPVDSPVAKGQAHRGDQDAVHDRQVFGYSANVDGADKMNYVTGTSAASERLAEARRRQEERLGSRAESKSSVARPMPLIHPDCEVWVHEMPGSVRRQLQAAP